jgi:hypothetical protein
MVGARKPSEFTAEAGKTSIVSILLSDIIATSNDSF